MRLERVGEIAHGRLKAGRAFVKVARYALGAGGRRQNLADPLSAVRRMGATVVTALDLDDGMGERDGNAMAARGLADHIDEPGRGRVALDMRRGLPRRGRRGFAARRRRLLDRRRDIHRTAVRISGGNRSLAQEDERNGQSSR